MDTLRGNFDSGDGFDDYRDYDAGEDEGSRDMPPAAIGQDERRMQVRAYNHWASQLGDNAFPSIEELEPEELTDFGPYSVLLDFTAGIENPAIQYLGTKLGAECDVDADIETLDDVPSRSLLSRITDHYMQILANQAPIGFEAEFVNQRGATLAYRGILLPYSSDDDTIDFIFGVINWKEMADQKTSDELLLEIDQALEVQDDDEEDDRDEPMLREPDPVTDWADGPAGDDIGDLRLSGNDQDETEETFAMPEPSFGRAEPGASEAERYKPEEHGDLEEALELGAEHEAEHEATDEDEAEELTDESEDDEAEDEEDAIDQWRDDFSNRLLSASGEDDEDEEADTGFAPLDVFTPRTTTKRPLDLGEALDSGDAEGVAMLPTGANDPEPAIPQAYEPAQSDEPVRSYDLPESYEPETDDWAFDPADDIEAGEGEAGETEANEIESHSEATESESAPLAIAAEPDPEPVAPAEGESLHDTLAAARDLALAARSSEERTRSALYHAVSRAYDVSLAAQEAPDEFAELIAENDLVVQDRAPMTPVVKLVFGTSYDKTRLTEYAAVLTHAHRLELGRGQLSEYLSRAEGGLKGVVQAERRIKREEAGESPEPADALNEKLARRLRKIEPTGFDALDSEGAEFGLVMIRRLAGGAVVLVGEVEGDLPLVERAARRLLA